MPIRLLDADDQNLTQYDPERDVPELRELWIKYASPLYKDLLDADSVVTTGPAHLPITMPEVVKIEPPEIEPPDKRLGDILKKKEAEKKP